MSFTNAELQAIYASLNIGAAGPASDQALVAALAQQTRVGQLSDADALQSVYDLVDDTTGVAALTYQFFTGSLPTADGFAYLVNSTTNANDLNDPYYAQFNQENRFINFSLNLALGTADNAAAFSAVYGGDTDLREALAIAYEKAIGTANAQANGIDVGAALDFLSGDDQVAFYTQLAVERGGVDPSDPVALDLAIKAVAIGELLNVTASSDIGNYANSLNQFYADLQDGTAAGAGQDLLDAYPPSATVTLTAQADTMTANTFNAPRVFTPGGNDQINSLNDDDVLTGVGANPTLNLTFVNDSDTGDTSIAPTLHNIATINVDIRTDFDATLDLQDADGTTDVNIRGVDAGDVTIDNIQSVVDMSITNSNAPSSDVAFLFDTDAVSGAADEATLALDGAQVGGVYIEDAAGSFKDGIETLNIVATGGASDIGYLETEDMQTLNISGDADLNLGTSDQVVNGSNNIEAEIQFAALGFAAGSLTTIDASTFTGDLSINLGGEVVANLDDSSGIPVDFSFKGGSGNDTVWALGGIDSAKDVIDGGAGDNTFGVYNSVGKGTISNFQSLVVNVGTPDAGFFTNITGVTVDTSLFADLEHITVRNIGSENDTGDLVPEANDSFIELTKLSGPAAEDITVQHGTTGNNGIEALTLVASMAKGSDTLGLTIANGVNMDPRFGFQLASTGVTDLSIADSDTEQNSVRVFDFGNIENLTVTGGTKGQFLNLDTGRSDGGGLNGELNSGLYQRDTDGGAGPDGTGVVDLGANGTERYDADIDASTFVGDLTVRVGNTAGVSQTIAMGSGNDTVIFDTAGDTRAGLTISDTVSGGAGNDVLAIDGNGVNITLGASEWTNVSGFETIRLIGNATAEDGVANDYGNNSYNLRLTDDLIDNNGVNGLINIVNDSGNGNNIERGVTIDARSLSADHSFTYDGEEGVGQTADRFILADANINGMAIIDGGALAGGGTNFDVLEARNSSVVTIGDLEGISNVGTIEFTNDTASVQQSVLEIDDATIARLADGGTLHIGVSGNPLLPAAATLLTIEDDAVVTGSYDITVSGSGAFVLDNSSAAGIVINGDASDNTITGNTGDDTISGLDGDDTLNGAAGDDTIDGGNGADVITGGTGIDTVTGGAGADTFVFGFGDAANAPTGTDAGAAGLSNGDVLNFGAGGVDVITDYDDAADVIDLPGVLTLGATFDVDAVNYGLANGEGVVIAGNFVGSTFTIDQVNGADSVLAYDADAGAGISIEFVVLTDVGAVGGVPPTIATADFI